MLLAIALIVTAELLARYAAEHAKGRSQTLQSPAPSGADISSAQLFTHSWLRGPAFPGWPAPSRTTPAYLPATTRPRFLERLSAKEP